MIELSEVVKSYSSGWLRRTESIRALDGVTLRVEPGTSLGIVGLNGAGKSTLLRILLGYARPTSGHVNVGGLPPRTYVERFGIAYVPEHAAVPRDWTVRGGLRAYALLGNSDGDAWDRVERAIKRLGLDAVAERKVGSLSKGTLQRVAIAQTLLTQRKLMVLDEPTDGLDPVWIAELRFIIQEWVAGDPERVLVLASHNLPEVERLTKRVLLLHNGRLAGEFTSGSTTPLETTFLERIAALEEARS
jgi:ABC-type multidrug transport system ATPase subunit